MPRSPHYNAVRQPIGERIMLHGRKLGTHLGVDLKTDEDRRMWRLLQDYERHDGLDRGAELPGRLPMSADLPKPDYARNMRLIGYCDQGGRPDGVQIMVHRGYAYIGHMFSKGFSVIDVRDPKNPRAVDYLAAPPGTWNIHLQTHDDLLLVINAKDMFAAAEFADERAYYRGQLGKVVGTAEATSSAARDWTAGLAVYDISQAGERRAASASCRSRAAASTASGTSAAAGPMSRRCSTASPTTSS